MTYNCVEWDVKSYYTIPCTLSTCDHCKCLLTIEDILTKCTVYKHSQLSHILINAAKQCIFNNFLNEIKIFNKL